MDIIQALTQELQVEKWQIEAAVKLIDEGIPFLLFHDIEKKQPVPVLPVPCSDFR